MMEKLMELGNTYARESSWKDYALVKFCLCAMGVIIGIHVPKKDKEAAGIAAAIVFLGTYIPLMAKVFKLMEREWK